MCSSDLSVVTDAWPDKTGQQAVEKINALGTAFAKYKQVSQEFGAHLLAFVTHSSEAIDALGQFREEAGPRVSSLLGEDVEHLHEMIDLIDECLADGEDGDDNPYSVEIAREEKPGLDISSDLNANSYYSDVEKRRLDKFCDEYRNTVGAFRELIKRTYQAVDDLLQTFLTATAQLGYRPFDVLDSLGEPAEPAEPRPEEKKPEEHKGGGPPDHGGGGPPPQGGGGGPPPQGGGPPPVAEPEPSTVEQPETVTITNGDRTISVQSPDGQGHVRLTVDDGDGQPKSYDVDLADGRSVIQDGPLTITAERPANAPDKVVVTVDDGSGNPTSYTLDYGDPAVDSGAIPDAASGEARPGTQATTGMGESGGAGPGGGPGGTGPGGAGANGTGPAGTEPDGSGGAGSAGTGPSGVGSGGEPSGAGSSGAGPGGSGAAGGSGAPGSGGAGESSGAVPDPAQRTGRSGEPAMAVASGAGGTQPPGGQGAMAGGMPMMGGAGGSGGGKDDDRLGSPWQMRGDLFGDELGDAAARIAGALNADDRNDDGEVS